MEVLLRKDGKLIVGDYDENRPKVYARRFCTCDIDILCRIEYSNDVYWFADGVVEWNRIWKDGDKIYDEKFAKYKQGKFYELDYIGTLSSQYYCKFVYKDEDDVIYVDNDMTGVYKARDYVKRCGIEVYSLHKNVVITRDYIIAFVPLDIPKYIVVDLVNDKMFQFNGKISLSRVKEAVRFGLLPELEDLYNLSTRLGYLGKYVLEHELSEEYSKVRLKQLLEELKREEVQESIVAGEIIPVMNIKRAIRMMDKVEANDRFKNLDFEVEVSPNGVMICHGSHVVYWFGHIGRRYGTCLKFRDIEREIGEFCSKYSLVGKLDEDGLTQWAGLLKSIGKDRIKM